MDYIASFLSTVLPTRRQFRSPLAVLQTVGRCCLLPWQLFTLTNMSSSSNITNTTADCFYFSENQTRTEVTGDMLHEMKAYSPGLLVTYCIVNLFLGFLSFLGNALVVLTTAAFSELHIVANIGLASLATASLLHGSILHTFLFAVGVNVLANGCPVFRSARFSISYLSYVFIYSFILNLCLVTAERFIGVVFSLRYHAILCKTRMVKIFTAAWIVSFLLSIPNFIDTPVSQRIGGTLFVLIMLMALVFFFYCNIRILCISTRHRRRVICQLVACKQMTQFAIANEQRFRGTRTVLYILATLLLCYLPAIFIRCLKAAFVGGDGQRFLVLIKPWTSTSFVMYSALSPFVYFFRSKKLRRYSRKLLRKAYRAVSVENAELFPSQIQTLNIEVSDSSDSR